MTDELRREAEALTNVTAYSHSDSSRVLLLALIEFLDLSEKDPERWPALETILDTALKAQRREEVVVLRQRVEELEKELTEMSQLASSNNLRNPDYGYPGNMMTDNFGKPLP